MISLLIVVAVVPGPKLFGLVALPVGGWVLVAIGVFVPTLVLEIKKRWGQRSQSWGNQLAED